MIRQSILSGVWDSSSAHRPYQAFYAALNLAGAVLPSHIRQGATFSDVAALGNLLCPIQICNSVVASRRSMEQRRKDIGVAEAAIEQALDVLEAGGRTPSGAVAMST